MTPSKFSTNVAGKIKEIKLDAKKGYQALFEVISNSIYSIQQSHVTNGQITIDIERDFVYQTEIGISEEEQQRRSTIKNITVTDNGEGFTTSNFDSFLTCYSDYKLRDGGKGVGRFTCLKVFKYVSIFSVYDENGRFERSFDFYPMNELQNERLVEVNADKKTIVKLNEIYAHYAEEFPTDLTKLSDLIIEHFFINFITKSMPKIIIKDQFNGTVCVNDYYDTSAEHEVQNAEFSIFDAKFVIYHVKSSIVKNSNKAYLCADNRTTETRIDLRKYIQNLQSNISSEDGKKKWYFAYITSPYLNALVNSERTELIFPASDKFGGGITDITFDTFVENVVQIIKTYLKTDLETIEKEKKEKIDNYINAKAPKYRLLRKHRPEFYSHIQNGLNDEKLSVALYKEQQEWELEIAKTGQALFDTAKKYDATQIENLKKAYMEGVTAIGKSCLTEYVVKRKAILDIFDNALNQNPDNQKYSLEEVVHKLICPMITTSDDLSYDQMNLWMIDEKLAYHYYLASDKTLKSQKPIETDSTKETDLAIYHHSLTFNDTPLNVPFSALTIIEFKRPMRDNYNPSDNPIQQVLDYISLIRAGKAKDKNGRPISGQLDNLPIYVYIVADITSSLTNVCKDRGFTPTPDNEGYFTYHPTYKAYIEVMSYKKVLTNANQRNQILFDKLFKPTN